MKLILICCYYAHIDLFGLGFYMRVMVLFETSGITRQMCTRCRSGNLISRALTKKTFQLIIITISQLFSWQVNKGQLYVSNKNNTKFQ